MSKEKNEVALDAKGNSGVKQLLTGVKAKLAKCPKVKIKVPVDSLNPKEKYVTVSINGYIFQIERGVEVTVPAPVKKLLERGGHI